MWWGDKHLGLLQRRLPADPRRASTRRAGPAGPRELGGDLAHHRPAARQRPGAPARRPGRGPCSSAWTATASRGDLLRLLVQPDPGRDGAVGGVSARHRDDRAGARRASAARAVATLAAERAEDGSATACSAAARTCSAGNRGRRAVRPDLPARRRRPDARPGGAAATGRRDARPPSVDCASCRRPAVAAAMRAAAPTGRRLRALVELPGGAWAEPPARPLVLPLAAPGQTGRPASWSSGVSPLPRARRRLPRLPRPGRRPDRAGRRQRPGLRGGAAAGRGAGRARPGQDRPSSPTSATSSAPR